MPPHTQPDGPSLSGHSTQGRFAASRRGRRARAEGLTPTPLATASALPAPLSQLSPARRASRRAANGRGGGAEERRGGAAALPMGCGDVSRRRSGGPSPGRPLRLGLAGRRVSHPAGRCRAGSFSSQVTPRAVPDPLAGSGVAAELGAAPDGVAGGHPCTKAEPRAGQGRR